MDRKDGEAKTSVDAITDDESERGRTPNGGAGDEAPSLEPKEIEIPEGASEEEAQETLRAAWPPMSGYFFDWLKTDSGKQLASEIASVVKAVKDRTVGHQTEVARRKHQKELVLIISRYLLLAGVIVGAAILSWNDKLDPVLVGLLSAAMGYIFGRHKQD